MRDRAWVAAGVVGFLALWIGLYGGASALSAHVPWRVAVALPGEDRIPLVPGAVWPYLALDPLLLLVPVALRRWDRVWPALAVLVAETVVAAPIFVLLPVRAEPWIDPPLPGLAGALAGAMNLDRNFFPSLHVAYAATAAGCLTAHDRRWGPLVVPWAAAITASTVLLRQHYVLDAVAGLALAGGAAAIVAPWARGRARKVQVDGHCVIEMTRFAARHRRYGTIAAALVAVSIPAWGARRVLRTGYVLLQLVDDWLDGDRACEGEPLDRVDAVVAAIERRTFPDDPVGWIAASLVADLERRSGAEDPVAWLVALIRTMQADRRRVLARERWAEAELAGHHRATFGRSLDLVLFAAGSAARSGDVPALIEALAATSVVRDLEADLEHGLCNVPVDVPGPMVADAPAVRAWRARVAREGLVAAERAAVEAQRLDRVGQRVARPFVRSIPVRLREHA